MRTKVHKLAFPLLSDIINIYRHYNNINIYIMHINSQTRYTRSVKNCLRCIYYYKYRISLYDTNT